MTTKDVAGPFLVGMLVAEISRRRAARDRRTKLLIATGQAEVAPPELKDAARRRAVTGFGMQDAFGVVWVLIMSSFGLFFLARWSAPLALALLTALLFLLAHEAFARPWLVMAWTEGPPEESRVWYAHGWLAADRACRRLQGALAQGRDLGVGATLISSGFRAKATGGETITVASDGRIWAVRRRALRIPFTPDPLTSAESR